MVVLPIFAILFMVFAPIFWFLIVPAIARMLTWKRFQKVSFHVVGDDTGYVSLVPTKEELPEGVVKTVKGYHFLPRAKWKTGNPGTPSHIENLLLRKFIWKEMGKPIWIGYAGKVALVNPATLAAAQQVQDKKPIGDPKTMIEKLTNYVKTLPKTLTVKSFREQKNFRLRDDLTTMLKQLKTEMKILPYTVVDPTKIKELVRKMYTPSQLDALATNREQYGMKKRGQEYGKLILGGALIIGLVIIAILLVVTLA